MSFTFDNIKDLYEEKKQLYGDETYRYLSSIFADAKELHRQSFTGRDHEQSWRAFKGKNFEKLIRYIMKSKIEAIGLKIIDGNKLEAKSLLPDMSQLKRNLVVNYGEFGMHLPDVDMVVYEPKTIRVLAVISSKTSLRERIAQTGYWKLKLASDELTEHIRVYFVSPDEDGTLTSFNQNSIKKARAIVETDLDGSYILTEEDIQESDKVKTFDKLIEDIRQLIN